MTVFCEPKGQAPVSTGTARNLKAWEERRHESSSHWHFSVNERGKLECVKSDWFKKRQKISTLEGRELRKVAEENTTSPPATINYSSIAFILIAKI
ncbi:hypothetical protein ACROYT_G043444 [Oculina patagonica]